MSECQRCFNCAHLYALFFFFGIDPVNSPSQYPWSTSRGFNLILRGSSDVKVRRLKVFPTSPFSQTGIAALSVWWHYRKDPSAAAEPLLRGSLALKSVSKVTAEYLAHFNSLAEQLSAHATFWFLTWHRWGKGREGDGEEGHCGEACLSLEILTWCVQVQKGR